MRIGQNPAKTGLTAYRPHRLGVAVLTYIPSQSGYFTETLEILRYTLASLHKNTAEEFDLLVFDNGSCQKVRQELNDLQAQGWIDWLILSSHNLGKTGALNWIFSAMPNELVCYTDSDVYFRPGWFEHSLEILEAFPKVGFVAAQPCFFDLFKGGGKACKALLKTPSFEILERDAAQDAFDEFVRGVNAEPASAQKTILKRWQVAHRRSDGREAVIGATHMQFLARREVFGCILPLPARYALSREDDYFINAGIDEAGYLQLSTLRPFVYHMGNTLDAFIRPEVERLMALSISTVTSGEKERRWIEKILWKFSKNAQLHKFFTRIYNLLFRVLMER
jgi:glycosyltransferase involved in cell wall biosynthesis